MDTRLIFRDYLDSIPMGGRSSDVQRGEWLPRWAKRGPERQIRRLVCQEKPLR